MTKTFVVELADAEVFCASAEQLGPFIVELSKKMRKNGKIVIRRSSLSAKVIRKVTTLSPSGDRVVT